MKAKQVRRVPGVSHAMTLRDYERLLGEDFESLAQAQRAYTRETKQITKQTADRIRATAKQVKAAERDVIKTSKNIKATKRQITKDTKQIAKTAKTVADLFKQKKQATKKAPAKKAAPAKGSKHVAITHNKPTGKKAAGKATKGKAATHPAPKKSAAPPKSKKQTQVSKPTPAPQTPLQSATVPRQRVYELRDLPPAYIERAFNDTLENLYDHAADFNSLLKPGEGFAARVGNGTRSGYTYAIFPNIELLLNYLGQYKFATEYGNDEEAAEDLIGLIKIIKFKAPGPNVTFNDTRHSWKSRKDAELTRAKRKADTRREKSAAKDRVRRDIEKQLKAEKKAAAELKRSQVEHERTMRIQREQLSLERARAQAAEAKLDRLEREQVKQALEAARKRVPKKRKG